MRTVMGRSAQIILQRKAVIFGYTTVSYPTATIL
jgi:hypothetical protein